MRDVPVSREVEIRCSQDPELAGSVRGSRKFSPAARLDLEVHQTLGAPCEEVGVRERVFFVLRVHQLDDPRNAKSQVLLIELAKLWE